MQILYIIIKLKSGDTTDILLALLSELMRLSVVLLLPGRRKLRLLRMGVLIVLSSSFCLQEVFVNSGGVAAGQKIHSNIL